MGRTVGVVVAGIAPDDRLPLELLGLPADVALAPFAVRHRLIDVAVSTLHNSGVRDLEIAVAGASGRLAPYRASVTSPSGPQRLPRVREIVDTPAGRLGRMLRACAESPLAGRDATLVAVGADHVLVADLRALLATHAALGADVTLACVPALSATDGRGLLLDVAPDGRVVSASDGRFDGGTPMALAWTGDLVVRATVLHDLLRATSARDDTAIAAALLAGGRLAAADLGRDAYWHEPVSCEAYYDAHMALCLPEPPLDLWNPAWPIRACSAGCPPAKVVSDASGHPGHVLNTLLGDGTRVCGGEVVRSVLGAGIVVEAGAEVEDALLLDGCRIGRNARVRRAIVGVGAIIGDGEVVGYDVTPPTMRVLPSGLTLVPPPATAIRSAAVVR